MSIDRGRDFQEKIDALDLIINVLREHEKRLDKLAEELEKMLRELQISRTVEAAPDREGRELRIQIVCDDWTDFKNRSKNSDLVVFDVDERGLRFTSISGSSIYHYSEPVIDVKIPLEIEGEYYRIRKSEMRTFLEKLAKKKFKCNVEPSITIKLVSSSENMDLLVFRFYPEVSKLKIWLAKELDVPPENVIYGRISFIKPT